MHRLHGPHDERQRHEQQRQQDPDLREDHLHAVACEERLRPAEFGPYSARSMTPVTSVGIRERQVDDRRQQPAARGTGTATST